VTRPPAPEDMYRFRIPTDPQVSPDGSTVVYTEQAAAPGHDAYRHATWSVSADGSAPPRRLTIGARHDTHPRFSPDGRTLAFLSDRRPLVEEEPDAPKNREDSVQVHLLPLDGGEARRLTDLPRGGGAFAWSPDGKSLVVQSASQGPTRKADAKARGTAKEPRPGEPPLSDYRFIDRLQNQLNGPGFVYDKVENLWLVEVATGEARRLTTGPTSHTDAAWSPDGTRIAYVAQGGRDPDLGWQYDVHVVDVSSGATVRITDGRGSLFGTPTWLPDGRTLAVLGSHMLRRGGSRLDIWLFAADGSENGPGQGRNLSGRHDLMPGSAMGSDLTPGEPSRLAVTPDGAWIVFTAPIEGSYELWRIALADGVVERLTEDRHYLSGWQAVRRADGGLCLAAIRSSFTETPDVHVLDLGADGAAKAGAVRGGHAGAGLRRLTSLNADLLAEIEVRPAEDRWLTVDGRRIQGWLVRPGSTAASTEPASTADSTTPGLAGAAGPIPLVLQIHGGPHTLYGWAPEWEFQVLAGRGMGVLFTNPRGSEGYGEDFNAANLPDWGEGPMHDVMAHVDALVEAGIADPARLGVAGGSYGGYLTNWIVGHTDRFAAAMTCRSVTDLTSLMLTGDLSGGVFGIMEFGMHPWEDPDLYRRLSPITYAPNIRTPLLIQHAENDLRCPISQAEQLFAVLRTLRRPVRLMRVPNESHELTRSGSPFRRVENLVQVGEWFGHFLVKGKRRMPPLPANRAGK
jgi:dipeptidyl aminopeptidase/acylaminoacyl peptidase